MSYEATFRKKSNGEEVGYFKCSAGCYSVAFNLLTALDAPEEWYQEYSFPFVSKDMDKASVEEALKYTKCKKSPDYYIGDKPYYEVRDILQRVYDSLSDTDEVEVVLF